MMPELAVGFEPTTCGLRNRCSTAELRQHFYIFQQLISLKESLRENRRSDMSGLRNRCSTLPVPTIFVGKLRQHFLFNIKKLEENSKKWALKLSGVIQFF